MSKIDITKVTATISSPKATRFAGNWLARAAESRSARRRLNAILRLACRVLGTKRRKGRMLGVAGRAALTGVLTAFLSTGALAGDETKNGPRATATGDKGTAIGADAKAAGVGATAIGNQSNASAGPNKTSRIGNVADGIADTDAVNVVQMGRILGFNVKRTGFNSYAIGTDAESTGSHSLALGYEARALGGYGTVAIGNSSEAKERNSVALGHRSKTEAVHAVDGKVTLNGKDYTIDTAADSVVSVGNNNFNPLTSIRPLKRQIINVAPGQVSATSTDAVNGSQLNAAYDGIKRLGDGAIQYSVTKDAAGNETIDYSVVQLKGSVGTKIGNVAAGVADTDAVNKGQLDTASSKLDDAVKLVAQDVAKLSNGASGVIKDDAANGVISIGSGSKAATVDVSQKTPKVDAAGNPVVDANGKPVTETKDRVVTGVADGSEKNDAVNKGQLDVVDKRSVKYRWNDKNNNKIIDDGEIETAALMLEENQDKNGKPVGTRLGNVAGGAINATSLEAVNGGQVHAAINSVAQSLGGGASVVNGVLSAPTYSLPSFTMKGWSSPMTFNNVGDALGQLSLNDVMFNQRFGQLRTEVDNLRQDTLQWNKTIKAYDAGLGSDQSVVSSSNDAAAAGSGAPSRKKRSLAAIVPAANTAPAITPRTIVTPSTNGITGVADGRIATDSTDAVNGRQLKAVKDDVTNLSADVTSLSQNIGQNGKKTVERLETLEENAVVYAAVNGTKTNSVQLKGGNPNAPVVISNLDEGKQDSDAVNVKQLNKVKQHADQQLEQQRVTSKAYTDEVGEKAVSRANIYADTKISGVSVAVDAMDERVAGVDARVGALEETMNNGFKQLSSDISSVRKEARQAAAIGLAASSLRFDSTPGKVSVAMGGGVWRDQGAFAFGAGYTSESGKVRANITGVASGDQVGVGAGLSFTLN